MSMYINDDEKNQKIEELIKDELKIIGKIKEKLKQEINKIDFILAKSKIDGIHSLVQADIEEYFNKNKERFKLATGKEFNIEDIRKEQFFTNTLKRIFKELEIIVKRKNERISKECILFKNNEGILISFLIENFRNINGVENDFEIYVTRKKLEELIDIYEVEKNFIEKLEENNLLIIDKYNKSDLFILLKNSIYTCEDENSFRKLIIQNYTLKINKKINTKIKEEIKNEIERYNVETKESKEKVTKLEATINNLKIEIVTILSIFAGLFSYLTINFNLMKDLLSGSKEIENLFFIVLIFCAGLVPIIVMFFLIKYLFLMPNDDSKELPFWKRYLMVIILSMALVVAVVLIYIIFWKDYRKCNSNFEALEQKVNTKTEEVQKLKKEVEYLKLKYEEQNRKKLTENPNNSNNVIILK